MASFRVLSDDESPLTDQQVRDGTCIRDESEAGDLGIVYMNVGHLKDDEEYKLLKNPFIPDKNFKFPSVTDSSGRNRSFQ